MSGIMLEAEPTEMKNEERKHIRLLPQKTQNLAGKENIVQIFMSVLSQQRNLGYYRGIKQAKQIQSKYLISASSVIGSMAKLLLRHSGFLHIGQNGFSSPRKVLLRDEGVGHWTQKHREPGKVHKETKSQKQGFEGL